MVPPQKQFGGYHQHCQNIDKEADDRNYPLTRFSLLAANNPRVGVNQSARGLALDPMSPQTQIRSASLAWKVLSMTTQNLCKSRSTRNRTHT